MSDRERIISALENCSDPAGKCRDCPYEECERFEKSISEYPDELIRKAVELLKEQEPRVLTLEEVTTGDECWLEHKSGVCGYVDCYISTGNQSVEVWRTSKQGPDYLSWESYLKDWRCWSARPTDEQREGVPWQD